MGIIILNYKELYYKLGACHRFMAKICLIIP